MFIDRINHAAPEKKFEDVYIRPTRLVFSRTPTTMTKIVVPKPARHEYALVHSSGILINHNVNQRRSRRMQRHSSVQSASKEAKKKINEPYKEITLTSHKKPRRLIKRRCSCDVCMALSNSTQLRIKTREGWWENEKAGVMCTVWFGAGSVSSPRALFFPGHCGYVNWKSGAVGNALGSGNNIGFWRGSVTQLLVPHIGGALTVLSENEDGWMALADESVQKSIIVWMYGVRIYTLFGSPNRNGYMPRTVHTNAQKSTRFNIQFWT